MRTIDEIIAGIKDERYIDSSGPILDLFRELVQDGRLEEAASSLVIWVERVPKSEKLLREMAATIVFNNFIGLQDGLEWDTIVNWTYSNRDWSDRLAAACLNVQLLRATAENMLVSIRRSAA